jgi:hypothetical protein
MNHPLPHPLFFIGIVIIYAFLTQFIFSLSIKYEPKKYGVTNFFGLVFSLRASILVSLECTLYPVLWCLSTDQNTFL